MMILESPSAAEAKPACDVHCGLLLYHVGAIKSSVVPYVWVSSVCAWLYPSTAVLEVCLV